MRRLVTIATLLGLFLMHGTALAASGCQHTAPLTPGGLHAMPPLPSHAPPTTMSQTKPSARHMTLSPAPQMSPSAAAQTKPSAMPRTEAFMAPSATVRTTPSVSGEMVAAASDGGHGMLCLADQPRGKGVGAALAVVAGPVLLVGVRLRAAGRALRSSPRGPPPGGSALLVRLCVSRT